MVVVPGATPLTVPPVGSTVATVVLLLVHVPPAIPFVSKVTLPKQTVDEPLIGVGDAVTVTVLDAPQLNPKE